ncbi:unnamed protein product [Brachionus calyciflorus]|uniref:Uncharacterized protein n=1 Tax=Brachionus calyciflorus TaxID=104777 RepID=A0A814G9K6_9BILA|nr:unnamed protein product [Brachionus calyciflorus]
MTFWILFAILLGLIALLSLVYLVVSGLFFSIEVKTVKPPLAEGYFIYKFYKNSYKVCSTAFRELNSITQFSKFEKLAVYYDDPEIVKAGSQRYAVGCFIPKKNEEELNKLSKILESNGYSFKYLNKADEVVLVEFPIITSLSILIMVFRVYPKIAEYLKERELCAHPMFEFYNKDKVYVMAPTSNYENFYVSEAK